MAGLTALSEAASSVAAAVSTQTLPAKSADALSRVVCQCPAGDFRYPFAETMHAACKSCCPSHCAHLESSPFAGSRCWRQARNTQHLSFSAAADGTHLQHEVEVLISDNASETCGTGTPACVSGWHPACHTLTIFALLQACSLSPQICSSRQSCCLWAWCATRRRYASTCHALRCSSQCSGAPLAKFAALYAQPLLQASWIDSEALHIAYKTHSPPTSASHADPQPARRTLQSHESCCPPIAAGGCS